MRWFKHMTDSHSDEKMAALRSEAGLEGYGFYWFTLEVIAKQMESGAGKSSVTYPVKFWASLSGVSTRVWKRLAETLAKLDLISVEFSENSATLDCPNLLKYRDEWSRKKGKNSGATPEQLRSKDSDTETDTEKEENPLPLSGELECVYCGVKQGEVDWAFDRDHFIPLSAGGPDTNENLVDCCHTCNQIKQKRIFKTIEDAREHIHWTLWVSGRQRYSEARGVCFGGKRPSGEMPSTVRQGAGPLGDVVQIYSKSFEEFWSHYPRKVGKGAAYKSWQRIGKKGETKVPIIMAALKAQIEAHHFYNERGEAMIPNPSTWLNQRRWEDEISTGDDGYVEPPTWDELLGGKAQ
jgi:HNH endonuclease.